MNKQWQPYNDLALSRRGDDGSVVLMLCKSAFYFDRPDYVKAYLAAPRKDPAIEEAAVGRFYHWTYERLSRVPDPAQLPEIAAWLAAEPIA